MIGRKALGLFGLIFGVAGCGGADYARSASYAPAGQAYYGGGGGGDAPTSVSATSDRAPSAAAPRAEAYHGGAPSEASGQALNTQQPQERPGLGTGWGEARVSHVHEVGFDRSDTRPFAVATLHYNDLHGVQALAAYHTAAAGGFFHEVPEAGGAITVSIVGQNGSPLDAINVADRTFVIGHEGERYSIVMTNHTNHRFESVASVDGLDVVNGRPAALDNRGYILAPFARLEIDGFRQSQDAVAAFRFSRVSDSYAAQTSGDRDVGVIGVAFFAERGDSFEPWTFDELRTRDTASPFPADPRYARPPR